MTAIALNTKINGSGNNAFQVAFDVIFPLITTAVDAVHALAAHPTLECWSNTALDSIVAGTGDDLLFWSTAPTYEIGDDEELGSVIRAIPTYADAAPSDWANNDNMTFGTAFPDTDLGRCLRGSTDLLPLLPGTQNFLGANNATLVNRIPFNLACALHADTSDADGDLDHYIAIRYAFLDTDPTMTVRGNTNQSGEPTSTGITTLSHTHMHAIWGDDAALVSAGGNRALEYAETAASNSQPYMTLPTSGFKYCDKIVAVAL